MNECGAMLEWQWLGKTDVAGEQAVQVSLFELFLWNQNRSYKVNRGWRVTMPFGWCLLGAMCHCCRVQCSDRRINKCLICCDEGAGVCPLWYSAGVSTIDVAQILALMMLQIYDANSARECNETRCSTIGFAANGAKGTARRRLHQRLACSYVNNDTRKWHL
jgi:hypothetical protein